MFKISWLRCIIVNRMKIGESYINIIFLCVCDCCLLDRAQEQEEHVNQTSVVSALYMHNLTLRSLRVTGI